MKKVLRKIAYVVLFAALITVSSSPYVLANRSVILSLNSFSSAPATNLSLEDAPKDIEKLINNVKVFYNPIAEQINLSFKLTKSSNLSIKVMDALGNEVLQLMNGNVEGGTQTLSFEHGGKLTAGFYFIRVVAGSETVVKRFSVR